MIRSVWSISRGLEIVCDSFGGSEFADTGREGFDGSFGNPSRKRLQFREHHRIFELAEGSIELKSGERRSAAPVARRVVAVVGAQPRLGRSLVGRKTGDKIDNFFRQLLPLSALLAPAQTPIAADMFDRRPFVSNAGGFRRQHVDCALFDAPMRLFDGTLKRDEGKNRLVKTVSMF